MKGGPGSSRLRGARSSQYVTPLASSSSRTRRASHRSARSPIQPSPGSRHPSEVRLVRSPMRTSPLGTPGQQRPAVLQSPGASGMAQGRLSACRSSEIFQQHIGHQLLDHGGQDTGVLHYVDDGWGRGGGQGELARAPDMGGPLSTRWAGSSPTPAPTTGSRSCRATPSSATTLRHHRRPSPGGSPNT